MNLQLNSKKGNHVIKKQEESKMQQLRLSQS